MVARLLLALAIACWCASAQADDTCGKQFPVIKKLVETTEELKGIAGVGRIPDMLWGTQPDLVGENENDSAGTLVFAKPSTGWLAVQPKAGEKEIGIFVDASGKIAVVTMLQREGPGPEWTMFRSSERLVGGSCTTISFPSSLNQPTWTNEYLELIDFNVNGNKGTLVGSATVERSGREVTEWYRYDSKDAGKTWSKAVKLPAKPPALVGTYAKAKAQDLPQLRKNLRKHVGLQP